MTAACGKGKRTGQKTPRRQARHPDLDKAMPAVVEFLFKKMRLAGIVPAFYAGAALSAATGAPTGGYRPEAALRSLELELRTQLSLSEESAAAVVKALAIQLIDVDLLPHEAGAAVAMGISQGTAIAQSALDAM